MSIVLEFVRTHIPHSFRVTPNGWHSGNCPMCVHNGQSRADTRRRGGFHFEADKFQYNCFNCGFKTGWSEGKNISPRLEQLLTQGFAVDRAEVQRLKLELARDQELRQVARVNVEEERPVVIDWPEAPLPPVAHSLYDWGRHILDSKEDPTLYADIVNYAVSRGFPLEDRRLYWSNNPLYNLQERLMIPFTYKGKSVGYTARYTGTEPGVTKYYTQQPKHFVFNLDAQHRDRKYIIVCEGPLDALYVDGVAICGFSLSQTQAKIVEKYAQNKQIICVPDRDVASRKFVNRSLDRGWSVAFPEWDDDCKDIGDAVKKYGRLFTLKSILSSVQTMPGKVKVLTKKYCR